MASKKDKDERQHIQVFARVRPFNAKEKALNSKPYLKIQGRDINVPQSHGSRRFYFDRVFDMASKQVDVYTHAISPIISEVLKGYNCTVFAYGQTGSGKTHTMLGPDISEDFEQTLNEHSGIIPRAMADIFDNLNKQAELDYSLRVSYLEIYNEVLNDLLSADEKTLRIYEDPKNKGAVQVHGLEEITVFSKKDIYALLKSGAEKRKIAATFMNECSSRSHTVFTITIHMKETTLEGDQLVKTGKLNLVDLAGSENIQRSGAVDLRAREAANINQSLLTLARVFKALFEKLAHIPYRESKLTRILQDSLGGKTKTAIIATSSPAVADIEQTISTLDYAYRARNIITKPEVNQKYCKQSLIKKYLDEIDNLKKDLSAARRGDGFYMHPDNYTSLIEETSKYKDNYLQSVTECADLQTRLALLEKQCTELEEVHAVTNQELMASKQSLTSSKNKLKKLRMDRHIRKELIDFFNDCELKHFKTSKELSMALDQSIKEHNFLCSKMEKFYSAMRVNENATDTFSTEQNGVALNMQESFDEIMANMSRQYEQFDIHNFDFVDSICTKLSHLDHTADTILNSTVATIATFLQQYQTGKNQRTVHCNTISDASNTHADEFKEYLQNEHIGGIDILENLIVSIKEHQNTWNEHLVQCRDNLAQYRNSLIDNNKNFQEALKSINADLNRNLASFNNDLNEIRHPILEAKQNEQELMRFITEYVKKQEACYQQHEIKAATMQKENNSLKESMNMRLIQQEKLIDEHSSESLEALQGINNIIAETKLTYKFYDSIPDKLNEVKEKNQTILKVSEEKIETNSNLIRCKLKQMQTEESQIYETFTCEAEKFLKESGNTITTLKDNIIENKNEIKTHSSELKSLLGNMVENVKSGVSVCTNQLSVMCNMVKNYVTSMQKVEQTGETPAKRDQLAYELPPKVNPKVLQYNNDLDLSSMSLLDESSSDCNCPPSLDFIESNDAEFQYEGEYVVTQSKRSISSSPTEEIEESDEFDTQS